MKVLRLAFGMRREENENVGREKMIF